MCIDEKIILWIFSEKIYINNTCFNFYGIQYNAYTKIFRIYLNHNNSNNNSFIIYNMRYNSVRDLTYKYIPIVIHKNEEYIKNIFYNKVLEILKCANNLLQQNSYNKKYDNISISYWDTTKEYISVEAYDGYLYQNTKKFIVKIKTYE